MKWIARSLPFVFATALTACVTTPSPPKKQVTPSPFAAPGIDYPIAPGSTPDVVTPPLIAVDNADIWDKLRGSFQMSDCDADPQIMVWAHRYTQNPQHFQAQMRAALSQLVYVQQVAEQHSVAGEFVLLPWVESQYQPVPGHRNLPAGMWQIVPSTAHAMGLHVTHGYDGRLDISAATDGVMRMLRSYYDELHDWRLVDYAFNRGEFAVQHMVQQHGLPPPEPAIPKWSVPQVTKQHLTKLLALACVIREPARFNVTLPTLASDDHLEAVDIAPGMTLSGTATHAGMPIEDLRRFNPALLKDALDSTSNNQLLMPHHNAEQFRSAVQSANTQDMTASEASPANTPASKDAEVVQDTAAPAKSHTARTHTVQPGESLWQIAHKYSVSVSKLERLNNLKGKPLKPGQLLKLDAP